MTIPVRPDRRMQRDRRFDLRTTALFFLLLAILLCVLAFLARTVAGVVEHRPFWAFVLVILGTASVVTLRSTRRRTSAARCARQAVKALEDAAENASHSLGPDLTADLTMPLSPGNGGTTVALDYGVEYTELDADGFERAIADLCARDDCLEVEVVGGAGDLGADVTAITMDGRRMVIQCKRYGEDNKVGSQDMQRFGGTCFAVHEADVAAVATTSDFTAPALEYARQCGIVCVNGEDLQAWTSGTGPTPWNMTGME